MKKSETTLKEAVMKSLIQIPQSWWFKSSEKSVRGIPDIIGCVNGHMYAIELKSDGGKLDELQAYTGEKIIKAGGYFRCVKPSNWQQIVTEIMLRS